jgi:hypothetical protein
VAESGFAAAVAIVPSTGSRAAIAVAVATGVSRVTASSSQGAVLMGMD